VTGAYYDMPFQSTKGHGGYAAPVRSGAAYRLEGNYQAWGAVTGEGGTPFTVEFSDPIFGSGVPGFGAEAERLELYLNVKGDHQMCTLLSTDDRRFISPYGPKRPNHGSCQKGTISAPTPALNREEKDCEGVWDSPATDADGIHTCGQRISWLTSADGGGLTSSAAREKVALELTSVCGACSLSSANSSTISPASSTASPTTTPTTSTMANIAAYSCNTVWDSPATDADGTHTCGERINWLISATGGGLTPKEAHEQVASELTSICGACFSYSTIPLTVAPTPTSTDAPTKFIPTNCAGPCMGKIFLDNRHSGQDVCATELCHDGAPYVGFSSFGCSPSATLFGNGNECCDTRTCGISHTRFLRGRKHRQA